MARYQQSEVNDKVYKSLTYTVQTFDTNTVKGIQSAERFKAKLENDGYSVSTTPIGLDRVRIEGRNS